MTIPPAAGTFMVLNNILDASFWEKTIRDIIQWALHTVPTLLFVIFASFIGLKVLSVSLRQARNLMIRHMERSRKVDVKEMEKRVDTLASILNATSRIIAWTIIMMVVLREIGVDIAPLIAGAGIVGLAVGFGAQELVRDFISGFFMLLENQISTGDVAIINGASGLVESIGLRTITLRDASGVVHVFQNGKINSLSNMTKTWSAMVFDIGVAYKEDTDRVCAVMKQVGDTLLNDEEFGPKIIEPMEIMGVESFGDSAVVIQARIKTRPIEQWNVGREYRRRLKKAFDEAGIEIPFPQQTIHWTHPQSTLAATLPLGPNAPTSAEQLP
jgi:small conductance mechanosensitive channel